MRAGKGLYLPSSMTKMELAAKLATPAVVSVSLLLTLLVHGLRHVGVVDSKALATFKYNAPSACIGSLADRRGANHGTECLLP